LQVLCPRLNGLVEEHFAWQWLDKEFTAAEVKSEGSLQGRFDLWDEVHSELDRLCNLSSEKDWAKFLKRLTDEITQAAGAADPVLFAERFVTFRTVALDRFLEVDVELLRLAGQLARWAEPIDILLRLASDDQHA